MIPDFTASHALPPFLGSTPDDRAAQSPFHTTMDEVVQRFAKTPARCAILEGLLNFREVIIALGFNDGYQWIDGSFVENVEVSQNRDPGDADIVTVAYRPASMSDREFDDFVENHVIFDRKAMKEQYLLDAIFIDMDIEPHLMIDNLTFYFSLFSHKRETFLWKGMLRVPLISDDIQAKARLAAMKADLEADA